MPCVPYAWQAKGETIELPSARSRRLNVLGFMNRACEVHMAVFEGSIDTSVVVYCLDELMKYRRKEVVVVMDNSPLHTSINFDEKTKEWLEKGLVVVPIARYSPELNIIEILWKKIKYEWMPFSAYESFQSLKESLFEILANVGGQYTIQFS